MTSSSTNAPLREPSLIDVEVLDFGPLYQQAVEHYISLDPERTNWPASKRNRIVIRTECRWGRINLENKSWYLLNEKGDGPQRPLSRTTRAYVALYAELRPAPDDPGVFEPTPFCKVPIDVDIAATLRGVGIVALEEFIRTKIPEMEAAYREWRSTLQQARSKILVARARRGEKKATTSTPARTRA